jgi:hypothetical protein
MIPTEGFAQVEVRSSTELQDWITVTVPLHLVLEYANRMKHYSDTPLY